MRYFERLLSLSSNFFFSSRRRHTRFDCDWSSDVCSSDLGESGPGARKMEKSWLESVRLQCSTAGIPFFFKQWGGVQKSRNGRLLNGLTYNEIPRFPAENRENPSPAGIETGLTDRSSDRNS